MLLYPMMCTPKTIFLILHSKEGLMKNEYYFICVQDAKMITKKKTVILVALIGYNFRPIFYILCGSNKYISVKKFLSTHVNLSLSYPRPPKFENVHSRYYNNIQPCHVGVSTKTIIIWLNSHCHMILGLWADTLHSYNHKLSSIIFPDIEENNVFKHFYIS